MEKPEKKKIYKYNEHLLFEVLNKGINIGFDETFDNREIRFLCPVHYCHLICKPFLNGRIKSKFECPFCEKDQDYEPYTSCDTYSILQEKALSLLDQYSRDDFELIRLDDIYTPELRAKNILKGKKTDYFISSDVKTDINGDTIVVLYIGYKGKKDKTQFFIKPEKLQLSTDYKDMDPAKVLAKIELTLKDRIIAQDYSV